MYRRNFLKVSVGATLSARYAAAKRAALPSKGLLAYYDFTQGANPSILYDQSGQQKNAAFGSSGPTWGSGFLEFSGEQYVILPNIATNGARTLVTLTDPIDDGAVRVSLSAGGPPHPYHATSDFHRFVVEDNGGLTLGRIEPACVISRRAPGLLNGFQNGRVFSGATGSLQPAVWQTIGAHGGGFFFRGRMYAVAIYDGFRSDGECNQILRELVSAKRAAMALQSNTVFDGDSLTYGGGVLETQNYPSKVLASLGASWTGTNDGVNGHTLTDMINSAPTTVDDKYNPFRPKNVCCLWGGVNDADRDPTATAEQIETRIEQYCQARRSVGWRVVVLTLTPARISHPNYEYGIRQPVNTWLRGNYTRFANGLADLAANPLIGDENDNFDPTYYQSDNLHITDAGYSVIASIVKPVVGAV